MRKAKRLRDDTCLLSSSPLGSTCCCLSMSASGSNPEWSVHLAKPWPAQANCQQMEESALAFTVGKALPDPINSGDFLAILRAGVWAASAMASPYTRIKERWVERVPENIEQVCGFMTATKKMWDCGLLLATGLKGRKDGGECQAESSLSLALGLTLRARVVERLGGGIGWLSKAHWAKTLASGCLWTSTGWHLGEPLSPSGELVCFYFLKHAIFFFSHKVINFKIILKSESGSSLSFIYFHNLDSGEFGRINFIPLNE